MSNFWSDLLIGYLFKLFDKAHYYYSTPKSHKMKKIQLKSQCIKVLHLCEILRDKPNFFCQIPN